MVFKSDIDWRTRYKEIVLELKKLYSEPHLIFEPPWNVKYQLLEFYDGSHISLNLYNYQVKISITQRCFFQYSINIKNLYFDVKATKLNFENKEYQLPIVNDFNFLVDIKQILTGIIKLKLVPKLELEIINLQNLIPRLTEVETNYNSKYKLLIEPRSID